MYDSSNELSDLKQNMPRKPHLFRVHCYAVMCDLRDQTLRVFHLFCRLAHIHAGKFAGVIADPGESASCGGDITRFSLDVEEETSTLLSYDVINLDETVSPELLACIQKEGLVLYEKV